MKVVVDTNVWVVSAIKKGSYSDKIIRRIVKGDIQACATHSLIDEHEDVILKSEKLEQALSFEKRKTLLSIIEKVVRVVSLTEEAKGIDSIKRDPVDNHTLRSAVSGKANAVLSRDPDVYEHKEHFRGIPLIQPRVLEKRINNADLVPSLGIPPHLLNVD